MEADEQHHQRREEEDMGAVETGAYLKEFLDELGLSQCQLGREFGVPAVRVSHVVRGKRPVTAEFALRLGRYFGKVLAIG